MLISNNNEKQFGKGKKDNELRNEFFKQLNSNFSLSTEEENLIVDLNQIIMNGIHGSREENNLDKEENVIVLRMNQDKDSNLVNNYKSTLSDVEKTKEFLYTVKKEIEHSFEKLKVILNSRNELSSILQDFNTSTKVIINDKEKITKLSSAIEKIYKKYEESQSIEAFFENTKEDCVEKIRFTDDYEEIEQGINFFTLNNSYVEAEHYLNTYNMLKRIAITRYYNYMSNSLQSFFNLFQGTAINDEFFNFNLNFIPKNMNKKFYNFPKNFDKIQNLQIFFEGKAEYDYEVKRSIEGIKQKFIEQRLNMLRPFYEEIFGELNKAFNEEREKNEDKTKMGKVISSSLSEISKMTIAEILFFTIIFQTKASDNTYILQKLTSDIYTSLYDNLRPVIISSENLDDLFVLFDSFSDYFGIFFLDVAEGPESSNEDIASKIIAFYLNILKQEESTLNENEVIKMLKLNIDRIVGIVKISKILIRPTILKLVQDIQEKIFFKINIHLKNNLLDLEQDFQNLSSHEEGISKNYQHFALFHFFLRRLAIVIEVLKSKLDKQVLNELAVFAIETFLSILNEEIVNRKTLTFDFEIYIIQQILLAIKLLEEFEVEAVESGVDIDFYSITDLFKSMTVNTLNLREMLVNSAPKVYDKSRDFKKILYNNLLKSYKILFNLVNEITFGRDVMDVFYKARNKEKIDEKLLELRLKGKEEVFASMFTNYEKVIKEIHTQIRNIDVRISEKLVSTISDNMSNIIYHVKSAVLSSAGDQNQIFTSLSSYMDNDQVSEQLIEIRKQIFNDEN